MAKANAVSDVDFIKACSEVSAAGGGIADLVKATGLAKSTVQQRRVEVKKMLEEQGLSLPEFKRGTQKGVTRKVKPNKAQLLEALGLGTQVPAESETEEAEQTEQAAS